VSTARRYVSPKREAQTAATREAILEAFAEQLSESGRDKLSPSEAAVRAGVSLRTVHFHFPNEASQVAALGEWFDRVLYPEGVVLVSGRTICLAISAKSMRWRSSIQSAVRSRPIGACGVRCVSCAALNGSMPYAVR
jgi:hypothetical protein